MQLVQKNQWHNHAYLAVVKSFLLWSFTLTVCLLVVGFPVGVLIVTIGTLLTIILQTVLPATAVLLVTGSIFAINVLIVAIAAAVLTAKGIHPEQVSWLNWLHGEATSNNNPVYASCPLTCALTSLSD
ncbi:hypothetical protein STA3757_18620 [Stanieria sp. NIES-3757]|nr:hypothetical protein STA3757_18620 [Stanieria sp. NIES-3757]